VTDPDHGHGHDPDPDSGHRAAPAPGLALIVATANGDAIGRDGELPWDAPEDLRHFRATTLGHAVIIGSATWSSIGRALAGRHLIVVSSRTFAVPDGVELAPDPDAAVAVALGRDPAPIVAGGSRIYEQLLPRVVRVHRTRIALDVPDADAFFPELNPADWTTVATRRGVDERLTFETLVRAR
jgi:dihydrofolate reductase